MGQGQDKVARNLVDLQPTAIVELFLLYFDTIDNETAFIPFHGGSKFANGIIWQGIVHDLSKLLPSEFIPYAKYFYGKYDFDQFSNRQDSVLTEELKIKKYNLLYNFDMAWLIHQNRNNHHWQYWMLKYDDPGQRVMNMPLKAMKEMICDWTGAGKSFNRSIISTKEDPYKETREWYRNNRMNIKLSDTSAEYVENVIGYTEWLKSKEVKIVHNDVPEAEKLAKIEELNKFAELLKKSEETGRPLIDLIKELNSKSDK